MSRSEVSKSSFFDIADQQVLDNHRELIVDGKSVESYARCFFNPLPPMYYRLKNEIDELCILEVHIPTFEVIKKYSGKEYKFHDLPI